MLRLLQFAFFFAVLYSIVMFTGMLGVARQIAVIPYQLAKLYVDYGS